ncbi:MAG: glutathione transferase [Spirochaetes bacterium RBG_16_49_21]|nr:MAG: glutathione transferase [Spirochaetes bacterium RBG_16_49_21]
MIKGLNHITFAVNNLEKSFAFYKDILGLKPIAKWQNGAYFTTGNTWIALNQDSKVSEARRPDYSHIAFTCTASDFQALKAKLVDHGCKKWSENKSEGDSFYFLDPDGHKLEIHVGDLQSRLKEMQDNPWDMFEYY